MHHIGMKLKGIVSIGSLDQKTLDFVLRTKDGDEAGSTLLVPPPVTQVQGSWWTAVWHIGNFPQSLRLLP